MAHFFNLKGFLEEFKAFALKGNVIDLAVAVVIGGAFNKIVSVFVSSIITPIIGYLTSGGQPGIPGAEAGRCGIKIRGIASGDH